MSTALTTCLNRYLTCTLGEETFGLDIGKVREVLDFCAVTKFPRMPPFFSGIMSLRGSAVPVVDLRLRLGLPGAEETADSCVIITEVTIDRDTIVLGALADSVDEVVDIDRSQVATPPDIGAAGTPDFITGIARQGDRFITLLDMDGAFSAHELAQVPFSTRFRRGPVVPNLR